MSVQGPSRSRRAAVSFLCALILIGSRAASADTLTFRDIRKPEGQARPGTLERVDALACGANPNLTVVNISALETCMRAHGWVMSRIADEPSVSPLDVDNDVYVDRWKRGRGDDQLHADIDRCARTYGKPQSGVETSAPFRSCMRAFGWTLAYTRHAPPSPRRPSDGDDPNYALFHSCPFEPGC